MKKVLKILLLEDSAEDAEMIQRLLAKEDNNFECNLAMNKGQFLKALDQFVPDIILSDNSLPQFSAIEALKIVRERSLYIPFILVTGTVSEEFAATIIKQGADDYILKDRLSRLPNAIQVSFKQRQIERERLEAVDKLKESNDRYKIVAKATRETIWDWDLVTDKVIWSKSIHDTFGYKDLNLLTDNAWWLDKIHPEDVDRVRKNAAEQIKNKVLRFEDEYRFRCADGSYKYLNDRSFLVIDRSGNPVRMIGAMQDITKQKKEEFRLKLLESVITNATDAVLITEVGSLKNDGQKIAYVNEAFTKMTGYRREEVIGETSEFLHGPKTSKEELEKLEKSIKKGEDCEIEIIKYNKNGDEFWVQQSVAPVADARGNITHFIAIERDVGSKNYKSYYQHTRTGAVSNRR